MKKQILLFLMIPLLNFSQVQIGQDIDGEAIDDESGRSISLSSDGTIVAIGAIYNNGNASFSGHVRVFENLSGSWTQVGQDIDGDTSSEEFGFDINLSSNGNILAVSAPRNNGNGNNSGLVRVYENIGGNWTQIGSDIYGEAESDLSGWSVSLSSDGSILAIGATGHDGNSINSGHVRIFENQSNSWVLIGDINGEATDDQSGYTVSLSDDGSIIAIGAVRNDGSNGIDSGHVKVFENLSGVWTQIGNNIDGEASGDFFGRSLDISSNGNIVAVGAHQNDGNGDSSGHVRIFENINGNWIQIGNDIDGEASGDFSGYSLSLSDDGSIIAIGAPFNEENGSLSGHVRIFQNQSGNWIQIGNDIDSEASGDFFGGSVSLSVDGSKVAVGAPFNSGSGAFAGHVRIFDLSPLLSLKEQNELYFGLYPNPTKNEFTIELENSSELKNVGIYNHLGQLVLTLKEIVVNTSKLSSGLYVVEVETSKGKGTKKLIIK